jgi:hypothetical protein
LVLAGLGSFFALGVKGLGGVLSILVRTASRELSRGFVMDFKSLDPNVRTLALVGSFLQTWAFLENSINTALGEALGLNRLQTLIVARNVQFTAKIHILKTAVWHSEKATLSDTKRTEYQKILTEIQGYSPVRNMMAHDLFMTSETTDGVEFSVIKAKGKLQFPDEIWSIEKFDTEKEKVLAWRQQVRALIEDLKGMTLNKLLAEALINPYVPTEGPFGLGVPSPGSLPFQGLLDSMRNQTTPETEGETPPTSQEEEGERAKPR